LGREEVKELVGKRFEYDRYDGKTYTGKLVFKVSEHELSFIADDGEFITNGGGNWWNHGIATGRVRELPPTPQDISLPLPAGSLLDWNGVVFRKVDNNQNRLAYAYFVWTDTAIEEWGGTLSITDETAIKLGSITLPEGEK
jgi:hypothetical protein